MTPPALTAALERAARAQPRWSDALRVAIRNVESHGEAARWRAALAEMPKTETADVDVGPTIRIGRASDCDAAERAGLRHALESLRPWRKGPFALFGIDLDAEWRSDRKWARVEPHLSALRGRRVLDVGCGNGYYGWRMCAAGARCVVGVDPTIVFAMQYAAIAPYFASARPDFDFALLPLRLEDLPDGDAAFDSVFSMGVLYHRRDPLDHLVRLRAHLRDGGELVVESLVVADGSTEVLEPRDRYARMRNVRHIPSPRRLLEWLADAGFSDARLVDVTPTTADEQRPTAWMQGESLAHALDPRDPTRTVEGHPAPVRAIAIARK